MTTQNVTMKMLAFVLMVMTLSSCYEEMWGIRGAGPIVTEEITLDEFTGIDLVGAFDVKIAYGAEQSVMVEGHHNIIDRLETGVFDGVWKIKLLPALYRDHHLTINITIPYIDEIYLSGSGDIETEGFTGLHDLDVELLGSGRIRGTGTFEVADHAHFSVTGSGDIDMAINTTEVYSDIFGSGDIHLNGTSEMVKINIEGSGNYEGYGMESSKYDVHIVSSGNAYVFAKSALDASITGSGNVYYKGEPAVNAKVLGSGNVKSSN